MSAEEILRSTEEGALAGDGFSSHVIGRGSKKSGGFGKFSAVAFATLLILVFAVILSSGNLIPAAVLERFIQETDVQYADAVESKILVFQQILAQGEVPNNTAARLKDAGVIVGEVEDGKFIEKADGTMLKMGDKIISASDFVNAIHADVALYNAFNTATYSRAAYYYDDAAMEAFQKIGTSRNNFTGDDFDAAMDRLVGEGSDINANNVVLVEKEDEDGRKYYEYAMLNAVAESEADDFVTRVVEKSRSNNEESATLYAAGTLNAADKVSLEQKSSLYYLAFMENISKMKAGDGNSSNINEVMNLLYDEKEIDVVDAETGEVIKVTGSMVESPSLYAILSGERVKATAAQNYSTDRVLKTVENQLGATDGGDAVSGVVTSTTKGMRGSVGRYVNGGNTASSEVINKVTPTINSSLINNSFNDINGIAGGEMLALGAVNVGKTLAKASGATAGDATAARSYARLNNTILAMDAEVDKMNRSPFDITSKNTFLGAIVYKLAFGMRNSGSIIKRTASMIQVAGNSLAAILPTTHADDEADSYLANFGDCETLGSIGAVGSVTCATVETFDTSTLQDTFNDAGFINFVENNTILKDGVRTVKPGSQLANFILFNNERMTPDGLMDGGIIESLKNGGSSLSFSSNILRMVTSWLSANDSERRIASGAAFVNSDSNADWEIYKYAQRYVSLARAANVLRQFDGENTSYVNLKYFEGEESPVVAFLNEYRNLASK